MKNLLSVLPILSAVYSAVPQANATGIGAASGGIGVVPAIGPLFDQKHRF